MAKKRESYEMLDTSPPPKSPWGKFIGLAVLLICIGGAALAYVLWPSEEKKPPSPIPSVAKAPAPSPTAPAKEPETKKEPAAPTVPSKVEPERPIAEGVPTKPVPPKETASSAPAVPATEPPKPIAKPKTPPIEPAKASEKVPGAVATPAAEKKVPVFVLFDLNQADVKLSERDKLAKFLRDLGPERGEIILEGHACALGPEAYNQKISERRAQQVAKMLKDLGIDKKYKVIVKGLGATQPVADNQTPQGREQNRRVMMTFTQ